MKKQTTLPALTAPVKTEQAARALIGALKPRMIQTMPKNMANDTDANRQAAVFMNLISRVPKLLQCKRQSLENAWLQTVHLGLEPSGPFGECFILPYGAEANFQIGYPGMRLLAERSGKVRIPRARTVYENDFFECEYGFEPTLTHKPNMKDPGPPVAYYAMAILDGGARDFVVWPHSRVEAHGEQFSKTYNKGAWQTSFEAMAHKTMVIQVCGQLDKSQAPDLVYAVKLDAANTASIAAQEQGEAPIDTSAFQRGDIEVEAESAPAEEEVTDMQSGLDPEPTETEDDMAFC